MSSNYIVIVLGINGKRTNVKVNLDTSILQIIEEACLKQNLDPDLYNVKHLKRVLDHSSTIRYSNIPNKALLELVETKTPRKESFITVNLATHTGEFLVADFDSSKSLWDILQYHVNNCNFAVPSSDSGFESVIAYSLRRISGEQLKSTTLKSLGLLSGKCMLRFNIQKFFINGPVQANVSCSLSKQKYLEKEEYSETAKKSESNSEFSEMFQGVFDTEYESNNHLESKISKKLSVDKPRSPNEIKLLSPELLKFPNSLSSQLDENVALYGSNVADLEIKTSNDKQIDADSVFSENKSNILESSTYLEPNRVTESSTVFKLGERNAILFNFDDAPPTSMNDESDDFYELSVNEVKKLYEEHVKQLHIYENMPMMTKEMRDMDRDARLLSAMNRHPITQLRICFPDRNVIQANFKPRTTINEVMDFIKPFLAKTDLQFHLYTVFPQKILSPTISLVEANCIPKARLYFGCDENLTTFLNEETLQKKSSFEGAAMEIVKPKISGGKGSSSSISNDSRQPSSLMKSQNSDKKPKWFKLGK